MLDRRGVTHRIDGCERVLERNDNPRVRVVQLVFEFPRGVLRIGIYDYATSAPSIATG